MADLITNIGTGITWLLSLFSTLLGVITDNPVMLYGILLGIVVVAAGIVFRVLRSFGIRSRRR